MEAYCTRLAAYWADTGLLEAYWEGLETPVECKKIAEDNTEEVVAQAAVVQRGPCKVAVGIVKLKAGWIHS
jgi:hypothetical protein